MSWTRLLKANFDVESEFELDADLRKDLLERTNNDEQKVNTILQILPEDMQTRNYAYWLLKLNLNFPQDTKVIKKFLAMLGGNLIKDKDINHYNNVEDLQQAIDNSIEERNNKSKDSVKDRIGPGSELVLSLGEYQVVRVDTFPAAKTICNTSKYEYSSPWCIAYSKNYFYQYEPPYHVVFKNGTPYAVVTNDKIWDNEDNDDNEHVYKELKPIIEKLQNEENVIETESPMFLTPQYANLNAQK